MNPYLYADLYDRINSWIGSNCNKVEWPTVYVYHDLAEDMAQAAGCVFDANMKGQEYAKTERKQ